MSFLDDSALRLAISEACVTAMRALPEPEDCERKFSASFEAKMKKLIQKERNKVRIKRYVRAAAVFILFVALGFGGFLMMNPEASASFSKWTKTMYENSIIYRFINGEAAAEELPEYELCRLPAGYSCIVSEKNVLHGYKIYERSGNAADVIIFDYYLASGNGYTKYMADQTDYTYSNVEINGMEADFYLSHDRSETNELIFVDENEGVVFCLSSFLEKNEMIDLAENITEVKK